MTLPVRVLHLVDSLKLGGIQTLLRDVLPVLASRGIEVRLAALHGPGPYADEFKRRGIEVQWLAGSRLDPRIPIRLRALLREAPVDVLHAHGVPSCWLGEHMYGRGAVPHLVQHLHHVYRRQHGQALQNFCERFLYRRGDCLVTCSQAVADGVLTPLPTRVIYNGVDTGKFKPATTEERQSARDRFGFKSSDRVLCMTGRITRDKGGLLLCQVIEKLVRSGHDQLKLLIVGTGPDEAAILRYCENTGMANRIVMTGFVEEVLPCLHAADSFVMASRDEGLGNSLLEAMATGLPALVANYPAAAEIVEDGINARLFRLDEDNGLTEALATFLAQDDPPQDWGARARERIEARFSLAGTVDALVDLYEEIL